MNKIVALDLLPHIAAGLRREGAKIIHCHGVFDLVHIGHMQHLQFARQLGNALIVTITADEFVNKGPGRPRFPAALRAESLSALACVDYVAVNHAEDAVNVLRLLRPHVYVKGSEYRQQKTPMILAEEAAIREYDGEIVFVSGDVVLSSTTLLAQVA